MSKKNKSQSEAPTPVQTHVKQPTASSTLLWKYLGQDELKRLNSLKSDRLEELEGHFARLLGLAEYSIDLREGCLLDFHVTQYWWASEQMKFTNEQVSIYYTIARVLIDNLREKGFKLHENLLHLQNMIAELNEKPMIFSNEQIKEILTNLFQTFFQQYKMYEYILQEEQDVITVRKQIDVELPKPIGLPYPPPLDEAVPAEMHRKYILKIPDEPVVKDAETDHHDGKTGEDILTSNAELKPEIVEEIQKRFEGLSVDDAKRIILEVTNELIGELKSDMRSKIKERETQLLNEVTKGQAKGKKN